MDAQQSLWDAERHGLHSHAELGTIIRAKKEGSPKAAFCSSGKSDQDKNPPSTFNETPVV
jgi:hypothetical protein